MRCTSVNSGWVCGALVACMPGAIAAAQVCTPSWQAQTMQPGVVGTVTDSVALPSGDLVVIGEFQSIGGVAASRIARFDGSAWFALGEGLNQTPSEIALHPLGGFVVSGSFTQAGSVAANRIARWDAGVWSALGAGLASVANDIDVSLSGDVYAVTTNNTISRYNGTAWVNVPVAPFSGFLASVAALPNGSIVTSGAISTIGGVSTRYCAMWNGSNWSAMSQGLFADQIVRVAGDGNGAVYARYNGSQIDSGGISKWNGSSWAGFFDAAAINSDYADMAFPLNGNVLLCSWVYKYSGFGPRPLFPVERTVWVGNSTTRARIAFDKHQISTERVLSLAGHSDGTVYAVGNFQQLNSMPYQYIARWNGAAWQPVFARGRAPNNTVSALLSLPDGRVLAGGSFSGLGDQRSDYFGFWDGSNWTNNVWLSDESAPSSPGEAESLAPAIRVLHRAPNGDIFASGFNWSSVLKLHQGVWTRVGTNNFGFRNISTGSTDPGHFYAMESLDDGSLVAAGSFDPSDQFGGGLYNHIARYDGTAWLPMDSGFVLEPQTADYAKVYALKKLASGDLVAGGSFSRSGTTTTRNIARWNGTTWSEFGGGITGGSSPSVRALLRMPNGDLIAAGSFSSAGSVAAANIAQWNGTTWQPLGSGTSGQVNALALHQNGDLLVGGDFVSAGGITVHRVARWNGSSWAPLIPSDTVGVAGSVKAIAVTSDGDIAIGGSFLTAGGNMTPYFTTVEYEAGCVCDSIDFNNNGLSPEDADIIDMLTVFSGGVCSTGLCNDIDFNNDDLFPSDEDLIAFFRLLAGGRCRD